MHDALAATAALRDQLAAAQAEIHTLHAQLAATQAALHDSTHWQERILDLTPDIVSLFDVVTGQHVYTNRELTAVLGYTAAQVQQFGRTITATLVHPDDQAAAIAYQQALRDADDTAVLTIEQRLRHADGSWRSVVHRSRVFARDDDGGVRLIIGTTRDVTAERAAEHELRAVQQQLRTVIAHLPTVLYAIDPQGIFTLSKGRGLAQLGLQPGQVVGLSLFELYREFPEVVADVRRALAGEDVSAIHTVGDTVFETRFTPLRDAQGVVTEVLGFATDITARVQAERERAQWQEQIIAAQAAALAELSTPLIPLSDQVVVMPLIGALDSQRAQQVLDTLLRGVADMRAQIAILDITGVPLIDSQVANALMRAAQAVQLLGAQVVLTGIRPEVAQTLVSLHIDLSTIVTRSNLQSGIAYARGRR